MKPESMDLVFQALAHQARRRVLDIVRDDPGCTVGAVCAHFAISRIAVLKHIRVLEGAGLLISEKQGRERRLRFNVLPIQMIHDRWSDEYSGFWAGALADLKYRMEQKQGRAKRVRTTRKGSIDER
jgi:DNA-binding transcriptional ArsR family regulator